MPFHRLRRSGVKDHVQYLEIRHASGVVIAISLKVSKNSKAELNIKKRETL
jgi:hypothetical protein